MKPDQAPEKERDDAVKKHPACVRGVSDIEIENNLEHAFDQKKHTEEKGQRKHAEERMNQHVERGTSLEKTEKNLPKHSADTSGLKGEDKMPNGGEED